MPIPYVPDDDHYYDTVNKSGDLQRHYADLMAEENAATIRKQGDYAANAIGSLPGNVMKGADFAMNRGRQQQAFDQSASEESRRNERFPVEMQGAQQENQLRGQRLDAGNMENAAFKRRQDWGNAPVSEEDAHLYHMAPGATNEQIGWNLPNQQGAAGLKLTNAQLAGAQQSLTQNNYAFNKERVGDELAGMDMTGGGAQEPQLGPVSAPPPGMNLTGGFGGGAQGPQGTPGKVAPQADAQLSDAKAAEIAHQKGMTVEAVKGIYRRQQAQLQLAKTQQQQSSDLFRDTSPSSMGVRNDIGKFKTDLARINSVMKAADQYEAAAKMGSGSWLAGAVQGKTDSGWVESKGQEDIRNQAAQALLQMDGSGEASEILASGTGSMKDRMKAAASSVLQRKADEIDKYIDLHSTYANDPQMIELKQNADKMRQEAGTGAPPQLVPKAQYGGGGGSPKINAGFFRPQGG